MIPPGTIVRYASPSTEYRYLGRLTFYTVDVPSALGQVVCECCGNAPFTVGKRQQWADTSRRYRCSDTLLIRFQQNELLGVRYIFDVERLVVVG